MKKILPLFAILFYFTNASAQTNYSNSYDIAESSDNTFRVFQKNSLICTAVEVFILSTSSEGRSIIYVS